MFAEIITIGDEILIGQIVDSNSAWLAARLNETGIAVRQITSIGDEPEVLKKALDEASCRADVVIMTGGLGPTRDDKTKQTLCAYFGGKLVIDEGTLENVNSIFSRLKRPMLDSNLRQAEVPDNCTVLLNKLGTAPGMWFEKEGRVYVSLPGVPYEMMGLVSGQVLPMLQEYFRTRLMAIVHRTLVTTGVGESYLAEMIAPVETALPSHIRLAYLPRPGMVRLRLSGYRMQASEAEDSTGQPSADRNIRALEEELDTWASKIRELTGPYIVAGEDLPVQEVALRRLKELGSTLATAESCTGGYIAHLLTSIPGASEVFSGAVVAYSNDVKSALLGVNEITLQNFGAVSRETVSEMAVGALEKPGADYAIAVSGIMGPGGGTAEKPVGTVWIAVAGRGQVRAEKFSFSGRRPQLIERTAVTALGMLIRFLA